MSAETRSVDAGHDIDIPLPAPTTLTSHLTADRLLSSSSSQFRRITRSQAMEQNNNTISQQAESSTAASNLPPPAKRRRRAYSIKDETHPIIIPSSDPPQVPEASSSRHTLDDDMDEITRRRIMLKPLPPLPKTALPQQEPLSAYCCPICLCPPTNATLTPCGHICCGECLFTAVRTSMSNVYARAARDAPQPRCPVCRAVIKGWDGHGGGVIGLKARTVLSL